MRTIVKSSILEKEKNTSEQVCEQTSSVYCFYLLSTLGNTPRDIKQERQFLRDIQAYHAQQSTFDEMRGGWVDDETLS